MSYVVRNLGGFTLMGITCRTTNAAEQNGGKIAETWSRFMQKALLETIPGRLRPEEVCAAYFNYESDHTGEYQFLLGAAVPEGSKAPDGMICQLFAGSTYAVFSAPTPASVIEVWRQIWSTDLKRSYKGDFEFYRGGPNNPSIEICIALF